MDNERPEFWRVVTVSFSRDSNYSNVPVYSNNNEVDDLENAKRYAEANNYEFIKIGECVTDEEMIKRDKKERNWYRYNAL